MRKIAADRNYRVIKTANPYINNVITILEQLRKATDEFGVAARRAASQGLDLEGLNDQVSDLIPPQMISAYNRAAEEAMDAYHKAKALASQIHTKAAEHPEFEGKSLLR
tara:strand:+ start:407 stop:733 length:327 start_codon:yes stop_codon:yes gene_type:complete